MNEPDIKWRLFVAISNARSARAVEILREHGIKRHHLIHDECTVSIPDDLTDEQLLVVIAELKLC